MKLGDVNHYRLFLSELTEDDNYQEILNSLHNSSYDDGLEIRINSSGGIVRQGQQLINVMKDKFSGKCVCVLEAEASSMAALVFLSGDERVVYEHSILMLHDYSLLMAGKSSENIQHISTYTEVFKNYCKVILRPYLSDAKVDKIFKGQDKYFNCEQMCRLGMATQVITNGIALTAKEYLATIDKQAAIELKQEYIGELSQEIEALKKEIEKLNEDCDS